MSGATVAALSIAPVKGLAVVDVERVALGPDGAEGDRRFFLLDGRGEVATARRHPALTGVVPAWEPASRTLRLTFRDGTEVAGAVEHGEAVAAELYGKLRVGWEVLGPFSAALSAFADAPLRLVEAGAPGLGWDEGPVTFASRASLAAVARWSGRREVDPRRFRMTALLDGPGTGFAEDAWVGSEVAFGDARVRVVAPLERCAIITRHPDSGRRDWDGLRVLADQRGRDRVCLGVICDVVAPGVGLVGAVVAPVGCGVAEKFTTVLSFSATPDEDELDALGGPRQAAACGADSASRRSARPTRSTAR